MDKSEYIILGNAKNPIIPLLKEKIDNNDSVIIEKVMDDGYEKYMIIDKNKYINDVKKFMKNRKTIFRNFYSDMPRSNLTINGKIYISPKKALDELKKVPSDLYNSVVCMTTASTLGYVFELIYKYYNDYDNFHLTDGVKDSTLHISVNTDNEIPIIIKKKLSIINVINGNKVEKGQIDIKIILDINSDNNAIISWKI